MEKSGLKDKCPACGVPAKMFEDYKEKVSEKRKFILSLDLHPILVHFPIAFSIVLFVISIAAFVFTGQVKSDLISAIRIISLFLPFTIIAAFFAGILDGNVRFKRVTTPILFTKIIIGAIFFVLSAILFAINVTGVLQNGSYLVATIAVSAICLVCDTLLGNLGKGLLNAKFPG